MLSNKLTFSLASLIVLIAFGLVFATGSVWAHDPAEDEDVTANTSPHDAGTVAGDGHAHPVLTLTLKDAHAGNTDASPAIDALMDDQSYLDEMGNPQVVAGIDFVLMIKSDVPLTAVPTVEIIDGDANGADTTVALTATFTGDTDNDANTPASTTEFIAPVAFDANTDVTQLLVTVGTNSVTGAGQFGFVPTAGKSNISPIRLRLGVLQTAPEIEPPKVPATVRVEPDTYHGGGRFMVTISIPHDPMGTPAVDNSMVEITESDIDPGSNARVLHGSIKPVAMPAAGMRQWTAIIEPLLSTEMGDIVVTINSESMVIMAATMMGSETVMRAAPATPRVRPAGSTAPGSSNLRGSLAAQSHAVIGQHVPSGTADDTGLTTNVFGGIGDSDALNTDLEQFFLNGGKILLIAHTTSTDQVGDVVISEIMWGTDAAADPVTESQWIELYNTTDEAIDLSGWVLEFLDPKGAQSSTGTVIDTVTNLGPIGFWQTPGQSGRSVASVEQGVSKPAIDIISMYRNIDYAKVEKAAAAGADATAHRKTQLEGVPDGSVLASWKASVRPSINLAGRRIGTPGAEHFLRVTSDPTVLSQSVLINEIGNGTGDSNDWVELLNTTTGEINLKKWELAIVTASATDETVPVETTLVSFPDNDDTKLPANGILLITNTDPTNSGNDLAAGIQINIKVDDQVKRGVTSLYYIDAGLKLPDTGKSLLVLRNANDKDGKPEAIVDAGGTLFLTKDDDETINTQVFPLQATAKGHGDVVDGDPPEDFRAPFVYKRAGKNSGIGEHHWAKVGWTGIGYDRTASAEDANGGTPGYPNDGLKEKVADLSDAEITISEVMVDAGAGRRSLPQWVELYNSSMTQAVNLNEWELEIQNANTEDVDSRLNATIKLGAMTIPPNQTVLIASSRGLNSGSDHFPATRVVNLWTTKAHREALEMNSLGDQIISSTGFYLKLTDKDDKVVDEAGNLDGNRRTADDPAWELPTSSEENRRASLIRVYEDGVALDGTTAAGWIGASDTLLAYAISHTYYGSVDDFGTPGFRGGGPLPVSLSSFRPARDKATGAVVIRWTTESELDNAGFNILRSETKTGQFTVINLKGIIPGHGTTSEKHTYEWTDRSAKPNVVYYYQIEDVSLDGKRTTLRTTHLRGNVNAAGKATTTWGDLKTLHK